MPEISPEISIVIPAKNEASNIAALLDEIDAACAPVCDYEVIVVDDGSDDGMGEIVRARMADAADLTVPLDVQIGRGGDWDEAGH